MARLALVTGGSGFIATHLIPALEEGDWKVRTCGRSPRPEWLPDNVDYRQADLGSGDGVEELFDGVTHVFHLAGASSSRSDEEEMYQTNVVGTENLMSAADGASVERFMYFSSTSVYGEERQHLTPVTEDTEPMPSRGYGKTKWQAEQVVWRFGEKGMPIIVARPVSTYGPGNNKLLGSAILDAAIERHAGLDRLVILGEPNEQRLVHIDDVVAASLHLMDHEDAVGRAFNIVLDQYPTSHDIVRILAADFEMEPEVSEDPDDEPDYESRKSTYEQMLEEGMKDEILFTEDRFRFMRKTNRNNRLSIDALLGTGFKFRETDMTGSISRTIAWYREHRWIL
jgi:nucleoside-diphosphate-sugar epimerase